jgi:hypothetical protein
MHLVINYFFHKKESLSTKYQGINFALFRRIFQRTVDIILFSPLRLYHQKLFVSQIKKYVYFEKLITTCRQNAFQAHENFGDGKPQSLSGLGKQTQRAF